MLKPLARSLSLAILSTRSTASMGEDGWQDIRGLLNLPLTENGGIVLWALLIPPISSFGQWNEPENYGVTVIYEF